MIVLISITNILVPIWAYISSECKDLISKMLLPAKERINIQQALDHAWIQKMADQKAVTEDFKIVTNNLRTFKATQKIKKSCSDLFGNSIIGKGT